MPVTKSHINSEFRDIAITDAQGNVVGVDLQQLSVANVSGLHLPEGLPTQVLSTDGAGNLNWTTVGINAVLTAVQGSSNIVVSANSDISIGVAGTANVMRVSNTTVSMSGTVNLGNVSNVLVSNAASAGFAVIGNDAGTNLQFEPNVVIPQTGYGFGRFAARGRRIFRAGVSNIVWNSPGSSYVALEVAVNCGASAQPQSWQKIHTNTSSFYALADTGVLFSTGFDGNGQLGTGAADNSTSYLTAITHSTIYGPGITVVDFWSYNGTYTDAGTAGACMVTVNDNGTFKTYMFGYNENGVLGNGTNTGVNHVPVLISQFTGRRPISVSFHVNTCMVVLSDGTVWGSGYNLDGQLGIASNLTDNATFTQATDSTSSPITGAAEVHVSFARGPSSTLGVNAFIRKNDGTVWAAGWGAVNRLSQGADVANKNRFVQVKTGASTFLTNVTKLMAAYGDCVALDSGKNLWAWGTNYSGYWGTGDAVTTNYQFATIIQTNVTDFYLMQRDRETRGLFILKNGKTYAAGLNTKYQLGTVNVATPVTIMSRVVFSEPGEYATHFATVGSVTNSGQFSCATMFRTNTNRVYISGEMQDVGLYGSRGLAAVPVELTDFR